MKKNIFLTVLVFIISILSGYTYAENVKINLTPEMFEQIEKGMSYEEVSEIIGGEKGDLTSEIYAGEDVLRNYQWIYHKNRVSKIIAVSFENNKVQLKQGFFLDKPEVPDAVVTLTKPAATKPKESVSSSSSSSSTKTTTEVKKVPVATAIRPPYRGTFFKCQDQTVNGCRKSQRTWNYRIQFADTGHGRVYYMIQTDRYKEIKVHFQWSQQGKNIQLSNKYSTTSKFPKDNIPTSESIPESYFEVIDDLIIRGNTGILYVRKGNLHYHNL